MSAEAIARLRATATMHSDFLHIPVSVDDLRALLDAHVEALDALEKLEDACSSVASWSEECLDFSDGSRVTARAVLAKAGRR